MARRNVLEDSLESIKKYFDYLRKASDEDERLADLNQFLKSEWFTVNLRDKINEYKDVIANSEYLSLSKKALSHYYELKDGERVIDNDVLKYEDQYATIDMVFEVIANKNNKDMRIILDVFIEAYDDNIDALYNNGGGCLYGRHICVLNGISSASEKLNKSDLLEMLEKGSIPLGTKVNPHYYNVVQLNEKNFPDADREFWRQMENAGVVNYFISLITKESEPPYSFRYLPVFGKRGIYETKHFRSTRQLVVEADLKDKEMALLNRELDYRKSLLR